MARAFSPIKLRERRAAAGKSVEQLAVDINRTAYSIHRYERGQTAPPIGVLVMIVESLGCSIDDLLDRTQPEGDRVA
jgi:transcriptional regulator with XRE-family HTH domain